MEHQQEKLPQWKLERYILGELPADELRQIEQQIEANPDLKERLAELGEEDRQLLERYPDAWVGRQIRQRVQERATGGRVRSGGLSWKRWLAPALAVCCLALFLPGLLELEQSGGVDGGIRLKGLQPQLHVFRKTAASQERLEEGAVATQGDVVQLVYQAAGSAYGAIFSIDGKGAVTWHLPERGTQAVALQQGMADTLGYAYELDDAPDWERFYFVTAPTSFELAELEARAHTAQRRTDGDRTLHLPEELGEFIFTLRKADHE